MELVIDFETRSAVDLPAHGAYRYAADPTTMPICLALTVDDADPVIWVEPYFRKKIITTNIRYQLISSGEVNELIKEADKFHAQNAAFEFIIWLAIMRRRYRWADLSISKVYDIMAQLAYHALPMNLDQAAQALNLPYQKDMRGHSTMLKLCKPRKPRKAEREKDPLWEKKLFWHESPSDIETVINYCGRDVEVERLVKNRLAPLPPKEREIWLLDQKINMRGIHIDVDNVTAIVETVRTQEEKQLTRFNELLKGGVSGPRSYVALKNWVNSQIKPPYVESIGKNATEELLKRKDLPKRVREVLLIKSELSKSSVAKFTAMLNRANLHDDRVRGWSAYHAAATGRWAAWGLQLHNNPRDCYKPEQYKTVCRLFKQNDIDGINLLWDNPYHAASRCVRGALTAAPGMHFFCTDFSAIEGRKLAYLAGEKWVVDSYRDGIDMYKVSAADLFNTQYDKIDKAQRQIGKVEELFLGYAGGIGAFATGAKGYGIDLEALPGHVMPHATQDELQGQWGAIALAKMYVKRNPDVMSLRAAIACDIIKRKWRASRPMIVRFWAMLQQAALLAIRNRGKVYSYRGVSYCVNQDFLKCRLPSGRIMHYYKPSIKKEKSDFGESDTISFMGMKVTDGKTTRQWTRLFTHGGKLCENVVQGACRDLLSEAMLRHEAAGYPIVLHCHDEDMAELPIGQGSLEEFNRIAEIVPAWASGMPITANGWEGIRYQK